MVLRSGLLRHSQTDSGTGMIPTGTDAPLYHRPYVTVGLIVANIGAFVLAGIYGNAVGWDGFYLSYGEGWQPALDSVVESLLF